ncbi:MAG TPA: hypothetical protein VJC03_08045, partial [bacterium]|nr:hypothetical protein [bacterium]
MRAFLIPPTRSLIDAVAGLLEARGRDYSSSLVVFPGKRPSHFLRKTLAKRERASFIPPRILSMDGFIDTLYGERMGLNGRRLEAIDAISILYDIHTNSVDRLGTANFLAPDAFFSLGMKIYHDLEELSIEGVAPSAVKEIDTFAEETIPAPMAKRLQTLSHFYETFYRIVDEKKYSTRSSRYRAVAAAAERLELESFGTVILAGFFALTESEKRIFRSFREKEGVFLLFQDGPGMEAGLADLGISVDRDDGRWTMDDG